MKYVIYSDELKGFLSADGTSLTSDFTKAKEYGSIGEAMTAAYNATDKHRAIFKFFKA